MSDIKTQFQTAIKYIKSIFQNPEQNLEIEIIRQQINLLHQYINTANKDQKRQIHKQFNKQTKALLAQGYKPQDLIVRFEKVIKLDKFRPKNMSLFQLAINDDLDNIDAPFDTFDITLSRLSKDLKNNAGNIRNQFNSVTPNRFILSKQFADDWIRRIKKHPLLVKAARNAPEDKRVDAYKALFDALSKDFCKEYKIPQKQVDIKVLDNLADPDKERLMAFVSTCYIQKDSGSYKQKVVYMIVDKILQKAKKRNINPFVFMCSVFAHEMGHVLDHLNPRRGALGPQVNKLDEETYVSVKNNRTEYHKSATELSSYQIEAELIKQLKDFCREQI